MSDARLLVRNDRQNVGTMNGMIASYNLSMQTEMVSLSRLSAESAVLAGVIVGMNAAPVACTLRWGSRPGLTRKSTNELGPGLA